VPTRQGWIVLVGAVAAVIVGRVFGIVELFVIGAGMAIAVLAAVIVVRLFPPRLAITRWAHPAVLTVGDTGRVDLLLHNRGRWRTPQIALTEPVGPRNTAHLLIASLRPDDHVTAGYRVPAHRRGVLEVGPAIIERRDLLGLASVVRIGADVDELTVAPQTFELPMPSLGTGVLGRHLLALAQRVGAGEFHSLRDYVDGDEPRTIHWKASARSEGLKVRQHEAQGVRRCIVVLDRDPAAWPAALLAGDPDAFERAVMAAGSLVLSADRAGLTTRFVTGGVDQRGPDVATNTLRMLAPLEIGEPLVELERDPGEGLGVAIVVTSSPAAPAWKLTGRLGDPTLTRIGVFTAATNGSRHTRLAVDASSVSLFRVNWHRLAGVPGMPAELTTDVPPTDERVAGGVGG
jgi:uncharacterized protein (DUF58 family)